MNNWQNWHQAFLANKKEREMKAFHKGLKGEPFKESYSPTLSLNSNWLDFINKATSTDVKADFNYDNNSLVFNHDYLNLALSKSMKQIILIYPYDENVIHLLLYKKLDPSCTSIELIKLLREPPLEWFTDCTYCQAENEQGWASCRNCFRTFEESLDD